MAENEDDLESFAEIAEDALNMFRLNIFIIAVYASVIALLERASPNLNEIFLSYYTIFGLILWFGTIASSIISYRSVRLRTIDADDELTPSAQQTVRNIAGTGLGTLFVVVMLAIGLFEGITRANVHAGIPITLVLLGVGLVGFIQQVLRLILYVLSAFDRLILWSLDYLNQILSYLIQKWGVKEQIVTAKRRIIPRIRSQGDVEKNK